jgi:hypothetical protein
MMEFMAMAICAATSLLRILRPSAWAHRSGDGYPAQKYGAQNFALALEISEEPIEPQISRNDLGRRRHICSYF